MFAEGLVIFFLFPLQATQLQTRYMELLTLSGDYYRFLGDLLKNMEQLKVFLFLLNVLDAFKYRHMPQPVVQSCRLRKNCKLQKKKKFF